MLTIKDSDQNAVEIACKFLREGKIISFATETVYGLACDAANEVAVENLYSLKKRDHTKAIAIFLKDFAIAKEIFEFDEYSKKIAQDFLPGPLTLVLKKKNLSKIKFAKNLNLNDDIFLAFRISDNNFVKKLVKNYEGIMAVTSANISGQNPAVNDYEVEKYFVNSKLDLLIRSGECYSKLPSTVVKIIDGKVEILRQGTIII